MHVSKSISTLIAMSKSLNAFDGCFIDDSHWFHSILNSSQYLSFIGPNISFVINRVCQYINHPHISHWQVVKWILRHLNHYRNFGLYIIARSSFTLFAYANADWTENLDDYKSTSGYCNYFSSYLLSWGSKK